MKSFLGSSCLIFLLLFTNTIYASKPLSRDLDTVDNPNVPSPHPVKPEAYVKTVFVLHGKRFKLYPVNERHSLNDFYWYKRGQRIDWNAHNRAQDDAHRDILLFERVDFKDAGVYEYKAEHGNDHDRESTIKLEVLSPPFFVYEPMNVTAVEGETVEIRCVNSGAPVPSVKWTRDGRELTDERCETMYSGNLKAGAYATRIWGALVSDSGEYTCHATNEYGAVNATVHLVVKERTKIVDAPKDLEVDAGVTATFRCNAKADPTLPLQITWQRNGDWIDIEAELRVIQQPDNSLMIIKANSLDSGTYACVASTDLDEVRAQAILLVHGEPKPPTLLGISCGSKKAAIAWAPTGEDRSPILRFSVQYNTSFAPDIWETIEDDVPATDQSYAVPMSPWVNYSIRVIAWNKHGPSEPSSHSSVCTTLPDVPYKNPDNVEAKSDQRRDLVIKWTVMPPIEHNAPKFMYRVYYKRDVPGEKWTVEDVRDWRKNELRIDDLPGYERYKIKVTAVNEIGECKQPPQEVVGYSGEDFPLEAPGNFTFKMTSNTSALLSWNKIPDEAVRGKLRGYYIEYWPDEVVYVVTDMTIEPSETQTSIVGLTPGNKYYVSIKAMNGRFGGPDSKIVIET